MNDSHVPPRHHVLIAGPGRSGTSLLVRVLSACGLETHLEKRGEQSWFDTRANAGLEDELFAGDAPYVVKSPWSYQYVEHVLRRGHVVVDHAIIPMRKLRDAAASRVIMEIQHRAVPLAELSTGSGGLWDHYGTAAGGIVYSMEPIDQERILATGFARLVEVLVRHEVPMLFLDFPRFVTDRQYLFERLRPLLPADVTADAFHRRLEQVVDPSKVRVEGELEHHVIDCTGPPEPRPSLGELDAIALRRALLEVTKERDALVAERDRLGGERSQAIAEREAMAAAGDRLTAERNQTIAQRDHLAAECGRLTEEVARLAADLKKIRQSASWRVTRPLRWLP